MTVLVVDDEEVLLYTRKLILQRAGFQVLTAKTGAAALAAFVSQQIDIAVIDFHLPDMDGERLCSAMKAQNELIPIVITSGSVLDPSSTCADMFILKGGSPRHLVAVITELTKRAA
jgi:DNA-binding response OmpR family regulator